jgi:hypothetical protein
VPKEHTAVRLGRRTLQNQNTKAAVIRRSV